MCSTSKNYFSSFTKFLQVASSIPGSHAIPMHLISHKKCLLVFGNLSARLHSTQLDFDFESESAPLVNWQIKMPHLFNADARLIMNSWKRAINMKSQIYLNICHGQRVGPDCPTFFLESLEAPPNPNPNPNPRRALGQMCKLASHFYRPAVIWAARMCRRWGKIKEDGRKIYNMASFAARRAFACCTIVG